MTPKPTARALGLDVDRVRVQTARERLELEQGIRARAGWQCETCGARHGERHPLSPSTLTFLRVVGQAALCPGCAPVDEDV